MEYVSLSVQWDRTYRMKNFYAIRLDADFHKTGEMCCDPNETGLVDISERWTSLCDWMNPNCTLIVWNKNMKSGLRYLESQTKKRLPYIQISGVSELCSSVIPLPKNNRSMERYMQEMRMTYDEEMMHDISYQAKCLVRIYRKLKRMGKESQESLLEETNVEYTELRDQKLFKILKSIARKCEIEDEVLTFRTKNARFSYDLSSVDMKMICKTRLFYKGERILYLRNMANLSWEERAWSIVEKAKEIEEGQTVGVGNQKIAAIIEKLSETNEQ